MTLESIAKGTRLAPDEAIVWQGSPSWRLVARDVFHLRALAVYLVFLVGLDAYQAWAKAIPLAKALHDSVPLAVIIAALTVNVIGIAWLTARNTRYTITTERVILAYGIALPATLSIPHGRIDKLELGLNSRHHGDIALGLKAGDHMPYLKLWPYARPWHLAHPQPMLRCVPQAAVVAGLATRALAATAQGKSAIGAVPSNRLAA